MAEPRKLNTGNKVINDAQNGISLPIGLDAKGLEKYQKEFFNTHNVE